MASIDIFNNDIFSMSSLGVAINKAPYVPNLLGALGIFTEKPIRTTDVWIEERHGRISLIPSGVRGTLPAANVSPQSKRKARSFKVPHFPYYKEILADSIQNVRAFGSETELQSVAAEVNDRLAEMRQDHEVTDEFQRVSALKGVLLDSDGSTTLYNYFDQFDVTQNTANFDWDTNFSDVTTSVIRQIAGALGAQLYGQVVAICGNTYFDGARNHAETKAAYAQSAYTNANNGLFLLQSQLGPLFYSLASNGFYYNNIWYLNYRGAVGDVTFVPDTEAYYFPMGVPDLFEDYLAPAPFMETVNTKGQRMYAKMERLPLDMGVKLHTQSNTLKILTRPAAVIKSTISNYP